MHDFAYRLRVIRKKYGLTLEQLAQKSGLTKSYISKLERAVSQPSISTVLKLSSALGVDMSALVAATGNPNDKVNVIRTNERKPLGRPGTSHGNRYETIASNRSFGSMNPFIVYPPHKIKGKPAVFPHKGEEFMFVVKGKVKITIADETYSLDVGDSVYFDASLPHQLLSLSEEEAEVLVVTSNNHG